MAQLTEPKLGYFEAMRLFSRNAKLYVLHVIGMDMIHGTWTVLFNLYLLAIGFDVAFVGARLVAGGIAGVVMSVPAGIVSDRIGRKASFILGDGMGAALGLVSILTLSKPTLMLTAVVGAFFSSLHHVSEPPFMHENSKPAERVHLFSISSSFRTGSAMIGSLIAGFLPLAFAERVGKVTAYRWATFIGLAIWALSLIPAVMLEPAVAKAKRPDGPNERTRFLSGIRDPKLMAKLVIPEVFLALGAGLVLPLSNVFFHEGLHLHESGIGLTFAIGQFAMAIGALFAPLLITRMSKVSAVVASRLGALPFIVMLGFAMAAEEASWVFPLVVVAWAGRTAIFNISSPIESAFNMEILTMRERATLAGFDVAVFSGMTALGSFISSRLIASSSFVIPFIGMGFMYLTSTLLFWFFFKDYSMSVSEEVSALPEAESLEEAPLGSLV